MLLIRNGQAGRLLWLWKEALEPASPPHSVAKDTPSAFKKDSRLYRMSYRSRPTVRCGLCFLLDKEFARRLAAEK